MSPPDSARSSYSAGRSEYGTDDAHCEAVACEIQGCECKWQSGAPAADRGEPKLKQ